MVYDKVYWGMGNLIRLQGSLDIILQNNYISLKNACESKYKMHCIVISENGMVNVFPDDFKGEKEKLLFTF